MQGIDIHPSCHLDHFNIAKHSVHPRESTIFVMSAIQSSVFEVVTVRLEIFSIYLFRTRTSAKRDCIAQRWGVLFKTFASFNTPFAWEFCIADQTLQDFYFGWDH